MVARVGTSLMKNGFDPVEPERIEWGRQEYLAQARRSLARKRLEQFDAAVGRRYEDCGLNNYETTAAEQTHTVKSLQSYLTNLAANVRGGNGLVLFGPSGTGKDHLLVAMAREAIWEGVNVVWTNGRDLFAEVRGLMGRDRYQSLDSPASEEELLAPLINADVTFISDPIPPTGALTEFQSDVLFRVLDARYRDRMPTWVTINVENGSEADDRMGAQLVDRLRHDALVIHCNWPSYRKAAK